MSTSTSTSPLDSLVADFKLRLDKIDTGSLQQWQFAYKEVIFAMGLKILEKFPRNALGPTPITGGEPHTEALIVHPPGGGPAGPSLHPAGWIPGGPIIHVAIAALGLAPPPPPPPPL